MKRSLLLVLGVFAMLYIRERRAWALVKPDGRVLFAMSALRRGMDDDREFARLRGHLAAQVSGDQVGAGSASEGAASIGAAPNGAPPDGASSDGASPNGTAPTAIPENSANPASPEKS